MYWYLCFRPGVKHSTNVTISKKRQSQNSKSITRWASLELGDLDCGLRGGTWISNTPVLFKYSFVYPTVDTIRGMFNCLRFKTKVTQRQRQRLSESHLLTTKTLTLALALESIYLYLPLYRHHVFF